MTFCKTYDEEVILNFITEKFENYHEYWEGDKSYYFALILSDRFDLTIWYDKVRNHFIAGDSGLYFDIHGRYYPSSGSIVKVKSGVNR